MEVGFSVGDNVGTMVGSVVGKPVKVGRSVKFGVGVGK